MRSKAYEETNRAKHTIEALAIGIRLPLFFGYGGISSSAWIIRLPSEDEFRPPRAIPSKRPNRTEWDALIMAVVGVCEDVPDGSIVVVFVTNMPFANCYDYDFKNADGGPAKGEVFYEKLREIRLRKSLDVSVRYLSSDARFEKLKEYAWTLARYRIEELGEAAFDDAKPDRKPSCNLKNSFPSIEGGYVEHPRRIIRPTKPRRKKQCP